MLITQNDYNYTAVQSPPKLKYINIAQCIFLITIVYLTLFHFFV